MSSQALTLCESSEFSLDAVLRGNVRCRRVHSRLLPRSGSFLWQASPGVMLRSLSHTIPMFAAVCDSSGEHVTALRNGQRCQMYCSNCDLRRDFLDHMLTDKVQRSHGTCLVYHTLSSRLFRVDVMRSHFGELEEWIHGLRPLEDKDAFVDGIHLKPCPNAGAFDRQG